MTSRLFAITAWLAAGHAVLFGLFWLLLAIPESNVAMLVASALIAVLMIVLFGWVEGLGLLAWSAETPARQLPQRAVRAIPVVLLGTALFVVIWYLTEQAGTWWSVHQGETDAWLMLRFGWTSTGRLHVGVGWLLAFVRYGLGITLSVALAASVLKGGFGRVVGAGWIRKGLSPRRVLLTTVLLLAFAWLPWRGVGWRPTWLSPNWQELVFVGLKLGALYAVANLGWSLILGTSRHNHDSLSPTSQTPPTAG